MNLTIKNLPDEVGQCLKQVAAARGRSLNGEVVRVLSRTAAEAERRQRMHATRAKLEHFVASLAPMSNSVPLLRGDRRRR